MFKKCTLLWRKAAKRISKSKCTTHTRFGALLEVEMWKKCTLLWREPHFKVKSVKSWRSRKVQMWQEHPVAPFSVRAFCTISSSSGPLKVHFVWEALSVFCSACTKWCGNWLVFLEKVIFRLCFHAILTENYVKFNIVWNRLCPHNMCHRIKIGKRKRGLRGIFIIIFVQNLSKSVRI